MPNVYCIDSLNLSSGIGLILLKIDSLRQEVVKRPWVKGVEILVTIRGMSMTALCDGLSSLPEGIQVFGGGAFSGERLGVRSARKGTLRVDCRSDCRGNRG
jgi:hypothetical protein